jgi:hypothetical protein
MPELIDAVDALGTERRARVSRPRAIKKLTRDTTD